MNAQNTVYFLGVLLTCVLGFFLAGYAWRHRQIPGSRYFMGLSLSAFILALVEIISVLSASPEQALFWFRIRYTSAAFMAVFWMLFALDYSGRQAMISKYLRLGLFVIPVITQTLLWTSDLHSLWVQREVGFYYSGLFWIADPSQRVPAMGYLIHLFYTMALMLAGIGFLFIFAWKLRRERISQALLVAFAAATTFIFTANSIFPILPKTPFNLFTPGIGLSLFLVSLAVFRFQFLRRTPNGVDRHTNHLKAQSARSLALLLLIYAFLVTGIAATGYLSYVNYERQFRVEVDDQLTAVVKLKVNGLADWLAERLGDAEVLRRNPVFAEKMQTYLQQSDDSEVGEELQTWMDAYLESYGYHRLILLDASGSERLASPKLSRPAAGHLRDDAAHALALGEVTFLDFHIDTDENRISLAILVPIYADFMLSRPLGVVVLQIDPARTLYPYLREWPVPSDTAETLLIRREGEALIYLTPTRFNPDSAMKMTIPLTQTDVLAVKAVLGQTGVAEGIDYRGQPVVGALAKVPGTPWYMVARMDTVEVYAPLRERLWLTVLFFATLLGFLGVILLLFWRQQRMRYLRGQLNTLEALRASEEKFRLAFETSPDAVTISRLSDGRFISVNAGFERILGYSRDEVVGKAVTADELWGDAVTGQNIYHRLQAEGKITDAEVQLRGKDGRAILGEISAVAIDLEGEPHVLAIIRDITERRKAEDVIRRQNQYLLALQQTTLELLGQLDLDTLLVNIMQRAGALLGTSSGYLELVDLETGQLLPYIGLGALAESLKHPVQPGEGVAGTVWKTGQPLMINDYDNWPGRIAKYSKGLLSSVVAVPLISGGKVLGVLGVGYEANSGKTFEQSDVVDLLQFASLAALAIDNARLFSTAQRELMERKQTEDALRARENLLNKIFDILPVGVWISNKEGKLIRSNPAGRKIWGAEPLVPMEQYGVFKARRLPSGQPIAPEDWALAHTIKEGVTILDEMLEIDAFDGQKRIILNASAPVFNDNGEIEVAVVVNMDITERMQAERERTLFFNTLASSLNEIYIFDAQTLKFQYINSGGLRNLQLTLEEAQSLTPLDIKPEMTREDFEQIIAPLRSKEKTLQVFETRHQRRDGSLYPVEVHLQLFAQEGIYLAVIQDITERKQAEKMLKMRLELLEFSTLHSLEEVLEKTLDQVSELTDSPIGFYHILDENEERPVSQIWSTSTRQIFCTVEGANTHAPVASAGAWTDCLRTRQPVIHNDFLGLPHRKGMPDGHPRLIRELLAPVLRKGKVVAVLGIGNKPSDYQPKDVEAVTYFADVAWEIAVRKQAEQAIAESLAREQFLGDLVRNASIAVNVGYPDGHLGLFNRAFEELTGYNEEELKSVTWDITLTPPEWREKEKKAIEEIHRTGKPVIYEKEYICKNGARVPVELVVHPIFGQDGTVSHYYAFIRDISERKEIEKAMQAYNSRLEAEVDQRTKELRDIQEKLLRQERLATLGQIAGSIAHELRNPLGVISNAVYYLNLIQPQAEPRVQEYLAIIRNETRGAEKIVSDLLSQARIKLPERELVTTAEVVERALAHYPPPENVQLKVEIPTDLPELYIDLEQITRVLGNLMTNAYQAMPRGGRLSLSARQETRWIAISVADTGAGITPENLPKLFEPLFTTKLKGIGLGLSLSKNLVEANDGRIEVQSVLGEGSVFTIYLPVGKRLQEGVD